MPSKAVLVLFCISQVTLIPSVVGLRVRVKINMTRTSEGASSPTPDCDEVLPPGLNLTAPWQNRLLATWAPVVSSCHDIAGYQVTLSKVGGAPETITTTKRKSFIFSGLTTSIAYQVQVQAQDGDGQAVGTVATAVKTTKDDTDHCPFPTVLVGLPFSAFICATVDSPSPADPYEADATCRQNHAHIVEGLYAHPKIETYLTFNEILAHLQAMEYSEDILVNALFKNGTWRWAEVLDDGSYYTWPVEPSLVAGVPNGGAGPDDYKMLYLDPSKDLALSAAKTGHHFGAMLCSYMV